MRSFQSIGLIGKHGDPGIGLHLNRVASLLLKEGRQVVPGPGTGQLLAEAGVAESSLEELGASCDLAIVVGGDGTLLHSACGLAEHGIPLLGVNLGRLGFLADVSPQELPALVDILNGEYEEEERFLLRAEIGGQSCLALNDVVIHKWNIARMIEFETRVDGMLVNIQRSDGMIVSTPTGSTAYALSGGGPLMQPNLNAILMVPICPHTLSNRPIVVGGDSRIEIRVRGGTSPEDVRVTCDGQTMMVPCGCEVAIRKHERGVRLIHPKRHDHFALLRRKLGWG